MKLYQNGLSAYMGGVGTHKRSPRGEVVGWSAAAARRQRQWAWSVDSSALTGYGYALTLTMRETPENSTELHKLRRRYEMRLIRMGVIRTHWVIEWQARGTPHMHLAVYFAEKLDPFQRSMLVGHWISITAPTYGADVWGQDVNDIDGPLGWLQYLAKHATRGIAHYQRNGHPEGWNKTGRLWGAGGDWPVVEPLELDGLSNPEFFRLRRIMRHWAIADAQRKGDHERAVYLRRVPKLIGKTKSRFQGAAEWIPEAVVLRLVDLFERENR